MNSYAAKHRTMSSPYEQLKVAFAEGLLTKQEFDNQVESMGLRKPVGREEIACEVCTYLNKPLQSHCELCGSPLVVKHVAPRTKSPMIELTKNNWGPPGKDQTVGELEAVKEKAFKLEMRLKTTEKQLQETHNEVNRLEERKRADHRAHSLLKEQLQETQNEVNRLEERKRADHRAHSLLKDKHTKLERQVKDIKFKAKTEGEELRIELAEQQSNASKKIAEQQAEIEKIKNEFESWRRRAQPSSTLPSSTENQIIANLRRELDETKRSLAKKLRDTQLSLGEEIKRYSTALHIMKQKAQNTYPASNQIDVSSADVIWAATVARCYDLGVGVNQDKDKAQDIYRNINLIHLEDASRVDSDAAFLLAEMLDMDRVNDSCGFSQDRVIPLYTYAAHSGQVSAQNALGNCYEMGEGVEQDFDEALHWYTQSADQGHPLALRNIAKMYEKGIGVIPNPGLASQLYGTCVLAL